MSCARLSGTRSVWVLEALWSGWVSCGVALACVALRFCEWIYLSGMVACSNGSSCPYVCTTFPGPFLAVSGFGG